MSVFKLVIVTPEKKAFDDEVESITVRTTVGDVGILKGHIAYVAPIDTGLLKVNINGNVRKAAVNGGLVRVAKEATTILTNTLEWADEIDVKRANDAKDRAMDRIKNKSGDLERAELQLKKALNRLSVAGHN